MFRKMMLSGLTVLGLGMGVFGGNAAQAHDRDDFRGGRGGHDHDRGGWSDRDRGGWDRDRGGFHGRWETRYNVYYTRGWSGVRLFGSFNSEWQARNAERRLERDGFRAFIRVERERC